MIRILKVKRKKQGAKIEFENATADKTDKFTFDCGDDPVPAFDKALGVLVDHVVEICELPEDYAEGMKVSSVSFSYGGPNETMGAVITAQKSLSTANSPLILNTPHLPSEPYSGNIADPSPVLDGDCVDALSEVLSQAALYIDGVRQQGDLFEGEK